MGRITRGTAELKKIDSAATDGLLGIDNSLAYRVHEIERHLHDTEKWFELALSPSGETHRADRIGTGSGYFQIDAGNDTWGPWTQVIGSEDLISYGVKYDLHRVFVATLERTAALYIVQLGFANSGADSLLSNNTFTEFPYSAPSSFRSSPIDIQVRRYAVSTKVWARCFVPDQNTGTIDFAVGLHFYEG